MNNLAENVDGNENMREITKCSNSKSKVYTPSMDIQNITVWAGQYNVTFT